MQRDRPPLEAPELHTLRLIARQPWRHCITSLCSAHWLASSLKLVVRCPVRGCWPSCNILAHNLCGNEDIKNKYPAAFRSSEYKSSSSTNGSASKAGSAVSWIFDGALNPISYTPFNNSGFLQNQTNCNKSIQLQKSAHTHSSMVNNSLIPQLTPQWHYAILIANLLNDSS